MHIAMHINLITFTLRLLFLKRGKNLGFFVARIFILFSKISRYLMPEQSLNQISNDDLIKSPLDKQSEARFEVLLMTRRRTALLRKLHGRTGSKCCHHGTI